MVEVLKQDESVPASYPDTPSGLSTAAAALDANMIWHRIEAWIAHRYTERAVVWIVEGPGDWQPNLTPATVTTVEYWDADDGWTETTELKASPLGGYVLPGTGPYRFTGTAGDDSPGDVPAAVNEAFRRLAEYMAEDTEVHGAGRYETDLGGALKESFDRNPAWMARAMANSGAGDLLRPYRRA